VAVYNSNNIPLGTVDKIKFEKQCIELHEDDIIVMCSDGVLENKNELNSDWIENFLKNVNTNNVQKIADLLVNEAIDNSYGVASDDMTVIVAKILKMWYVIIR
jgi:stage II sporulation protein E